MTTPNILTDFANKFGEKSLVAAESYKTRVFIGEKFVFKLSGEGKRSDKEPYVLNLLAEKLSDDWQQVVPHIVEVKELEGLGQVEVQTKIKGDHPKQMTKSLAMDLGKFLSNLHNIKEWDKVVEFEGEEGINFNEYLVTSAKKFLEKLKDTLDANDYSLAKLAVSEIIKYREQVSTQPELVLVHKDIHLNNLLVDENYRLTGVIDWGAAQVAPREWEFAIIRQRMPEYWEQILEFYNGQPLDPKLLDICGLIQSLRFWKSFTEDKVFVDEQRQYIKMILKGNAEA